jgi:hypothetical protein
MLMVMPGEGDGSGHFDLWITVLSVGEVSFSIKTICLQAPDRSRRMGAGHNAGFHYGKI